MSLTEINTEHVHYFEDEYGRKQGEYKEWHRNKQLHKHLFYVDDLTEGEYKEWHDNGNIYTRCSCVGGLAHGKYKRCYPDGSTEIKCMCEYGDVHGVCERWDVSGDKRIIFYNTNNDITPEVTAIVHDISNITQEEALLIKLKFNIDVVRFSDT